MVMPANSGNQLVHAWGVRTRGAVGHLYSPGGFRGPFDHLPYALDNDRFVTWSKGATWDEPAYLEMLEKARASGIAPLWALVPDVPTDRDGTLREWKRWAPRVAALGWPLAFAVQDGMEPGDVPSDADVVFVGGSDRWKYPTVRLWTDAFARVHVGRCNSSRMLWFCDRAGVESTDGTGWFRGDFAQLAGLMEYLERRHYGLGEPAEFIRWLDREFSHPASWTPFRRSAA